MADLPVFTKVEVYNRYRGGALISWELHPLFPVTAPITFTVEVSRSGVGDWQTVGTVVNGYSLTDTSRWLYGKLPRLHYRVSFTQDAVTNVSDSTQVDGILAGKDLRMAREMIRKERLRLRLWGICGLLYKRRRWGVRCPECIDWDTGQVKNNHCDVCYGTGFTGGYFDPVEYFVSENTGSTHRQVTDPGRGQVVDKILSARGIKCPWLDTGDFWVDSDSDMRYVIQTISEVAIRGVTIVFPQIEMRLAPSTDIIYSIERPS